MMTVSTLAESVKVGDLYYERNYTYNTAYVTYQTWFSSDNYAGITSIVIPSEIECNGTIYKVTSIGEGAFRQCKSLTSITIPEGVKSIEEDAFSSCDSLVTVHIPTSVTIIGEEAFSWCPTLKSIELPYNLTTIGEGAFIGCNSLESITIPKSVRNIGEEAFRQCTSLKSIRVEEGNFVYDSRDNCNAIIKTSSNALIAGCQNTIIPYNVRSIEAWAFNWCKSLTSIFIPKSVTTIGKGAFAGCVGLKHIQVELGNPTYDSREHCNAIIRTSTNTLVVGCHNTKIHNSVTTIAEGAFGHCTTLKSITIPKSVKYIERGAFEGCDSLSVIKVDVGNTTFDSRDNCNAVIDTYKNTLVLGCAKTTIPNSVTTIGEGAFYYCSSLKSIAIPSSINRICKEAFSFCYNLTSITIPNSVKWIEEEAFSFCREVTSLTIGTGVISIGERAFNRCSSLKSITIPNSVKWIEKNAFADCDALASITIGTGVTSIGFWALCNYNHDIKITYKGTTQQWKNIEKNEPVCLDFIKVHCVDGDIYL